MTSAEGGSRQRVGKRVICEYPVPASLPTGAPATLHGDARGVVACGVAWLMGLHRAHISAISHGTWGTWWVSGGVAVNCGDTPSARDTRVVWAGEGMGEGRP